MEPAPLDRHRCRLLVVSFALYAFHTDRRPRGRFDLAQIAESPVIGERPVLLPGGAGGFDQLKVRVGHEIGTILRRWTFYALLLVGIAACVGSLLGDEAIAETPVLPYTYVIIDIGGRRVRVRRAARADRVWRAS